MLTVDALAQVAWECVHFISLGEEAMLRTELVAENIQVCQIEGVVLRCSFIQLLTHTP